MPATINYADLFGYDSIVAAIIFAVLYVPLDIFLTLKWFKTRSGVVVTITIFCTIRVAAFVLRAILIGIDSVGENQGALIADQVLFGIGFYGLLLASFELVVSREKQLNELEAKSQNFIQKRKRSLFSIMGIVAVILSIVASAKSDHPADAAPFRKASLVIFLVLAIVQWLQTIVLIKKENLSGYAPMVNDLSAKPAAVVFSILSAMILVRGVFLVATMNDTHITYDEKFWYPLVALPEIIAAALYCTPGLIPHVFKLPR